MTYTKEQQIKSISQTDNLGIHEKYLKYTLGTQEWLSAVDLERMLDVMELRQHIHIARFNAADIGQALAAARTAHQNSSVPYSIPFLLNKGREGLNSGAHWFTAVITVDPVRHTVSYQVNDSFALSSDKKNEIANTLKAALNLEEEGLRAFPDDWILEQQDIVGSSTPKEAYTCGYRALHALLNAPTLASIVNKNSEATAYANCANDSDSLVRSVYKTQLEHFVVAAEQLEGLIRELDFIPAGGQEDKRQLAPSNISAFLEYLESLLPREMDNYQVNDSVIKKLNELRNTDTSITFPLIADDTLEPSDYEAFFLQLHGKLIENNQILDKLLLTPCDSKTLDGVIVFLADKVPLRFNELELDITLLPKEDVAHFVIKLKTLLPNLSEHELKKLAIIDPNGLINKEQWQELSTLVMERAITVNVLLPVDLQKSSLQQELDQTVAINQFNKIENPIVALNDLTETNIVFSNQGKRTRQRVDPTASLSVDIEQQQQQQTEVIQDVTRSKLNVSEHKEFGDLDILATFSSNQFLDRLNNGEFNIPDASYLLSKDNAERMWQNWFGHIFTVNGSETVISPNRYVHGVSAQACEQLLKHAQKFQSGFDQNHLPAGFVWINYPLGSQYRVLHYDEKTALPTHLRDELAPVLLDSPKALPLVYPVFTGLIEKLRNSRHEEGKFIAEQWDKLQALEYDKDAVALFQKHLPVLASLDHNSLTELFDLTFDETFDKKTFDFILSNAEKLTELLPSLMTADIRSPALNALLRLPDTTVDAVKLIYSRPRKESFNLLLTALSDDENLANEVVIWKEKIPSINSNALLQVYSQQGTPGLKRLFAQWSNTEPVVLKGLHDTLFSHAQSYMPLLAPEYQEAVTAISGFTGVKKEWWNALLKVHGAGVGYDDLPSLLKSFKQFSAFIETKGLSFYSLPDNSFYDVNSMPVALARMSTLLNQVPDVDLKVQWSTFSQLSLASTGAIRALNNAQKDGGKCTLFIPEMREDGYRRLVGYRPSESWYQESNSADFQKYLAYTPNRLSASFYQQAMEAIDKRPFKAEVKAQLVSLLLASTTGEGNHFFLGSEKESREQLEQILNTLEHLPLPALIKKIPTVEDNAREEFVLRLHSLKAPPALPVLVKLFSLIANSVKLETSNPFKVKAEIENKLNALSDTCDKLEIATKIYDNSIYDGMRFYGDEEYSRPAKESIFYSHIETTLELMGYNEQANQIAEPTEQRKLLITLISTFHFQPNDAYSVLMFVELLVNSIDKEGSEYFLKLLTQMTQANPVLNADDFGRLVNEFAVIAFEHPGLPSYKSLIDDYIEQKMADYYPPAFFEKLRSVGIDTHIENLVLEQFDKQSQEQVLAILNQFMQPGENATHNAVVTKIAEIIRPLSAIEKKNFLDNLQRQELYQNGAHDKKLSITSFDRLLDAIIARGQPNDFLYLLAQDESKDTAGLTAKALLYLNTLLPDLEKNKSESISKVNALELATQLLLNSSAESLTTSVKASRANSLDDFAVFLEQKMTEISDGKEVDLKALQDSVEHFKSQNTAEFGSLTLLLKQLREFNYIEPVVEAVVESVVEPVVEPVKVPESGGLLSAVTWGLSAIVSYFGYGQKVEPTVVDKPVLKPQVNLADVHELKLADVKNLNLADVLKDIHSEQTRRTLYPVVFADVMQAVYKVAEQHPGTKDLLCSFMREYIQDQSKSADSLIANTLACITTMEQEFALLDNADIIRSLCFHYSDEESHLKPDDLLSLMRDPDYAALAPENKKLILNIVAALLNNKKEVSLPEFKNLVSSCAKPQSGEVFLASLKEFYKQAPYPSLGQLKEWHEATKDSATYAQDLSDKYAAFDKHPCEREIGGPGSSKKGNGFIFADAQQKAAQFQGVHFSDPELRAMAAETTRVRDVSTADLIKELKQAAQDPIKLVALAAELLYRSKGQEGGIGSSFELNTTQYLAILSSLKSGHHNTSEIGTGEGKSRIMAVSNICQFAMGKTVDFITSDVQLATRDYLEYQSYFSMVGAKTNIITADTSPDEYCIGGINYSDAANLSLFRNKARSLGTGNKVIDSDPKKRALMLDEADKTFFDATATRYNFSTEADKSLKDMEWIYPLLIEFFQNDPDKEIEKLYYDDVDACNKKFKAFISSEATPDQITKFKSLSQAQIETWLDSAVIARTLKYDKHFAIDADSTVITPSGPKIASEAKLIIDGRKSGNSKFSFGVHQCLHAHLNMLKQHPDRARPGEEIVVSKLMDCKQNFSIDSEKQIIFSSGSKNLVDDYKDGTLIAVTGTAGSIIERQEATHLYGDMKFISVPRHQGLNRHEKAVRLNKNQHAQIDVLVEYIQDCRRNEQPILIICENDNKSKLMYKALEAALAAKGDVGSMQLISNDLSSDKQNKSIVEAGKSGMVTVSTGMIGRGTDIKLIGNAVKNGLEVMCTYLPSERDMLQIFGRASRAGAQGSTRLVLNKEALKEQLGKKTLTDGFYTSAETYLRQQQSLMDRRAQCERLIINIKSDFDMRLTDNFFDQFLSEVATPEQRKNLEHIWMAYIKDKDQLWDGVLKEIRGGIDKINPDPLVINTYLAEYQTKTQALWSNLYRRVDGLELWHKDNPEIQPISLLQKEVGTLALDKQTTEMLTGFDVKKTAPHEVKIYDKYDPAHDGRSVIYSKPFEKFRAVLRGERNLFADYFAWKDGRGILFPDLRALWNGHISVKQYLLGSSSNSVVPVTQVLPKEVSGESIEQESKASNSDSSHSFPVVPATQELPKKVSGESIEQESKASNLNSSYSFLMTHGLNKSSSEPEKESPQVVSSATPSSIGSKSIEQEDEEREDVFSPRV